MVNLAKYILAYILIINTACAFETAAEQAYLLDLDTGTVLFEKDAHTPMYPSSMSKLMTTYILFKKLKEGKINLDTEFNISKKAWQTGGSKMFVDVDTKVKVEDLLRGMVVQSGNDATIAIAEGLSGDEATFAEEMNRYAKELGLNNSKFKNATGLTDPEHLMTAQDLAVLARHIVTEFPDFYQYFAEKEFTYNDITQPNRNTLIGDLGVDGMKTGFTDAGGYGLVSSAAQNGRRLICVVKGLKSEKERIQETRKLLTYGFTNFEPRKLFTAGKVFGDVKIWYGTKSSIPLAITKDISVLKTPKDKAEPETKIVFNQPLKAPIRKGDVIGKLEIKLSDTNIHTVELLAEEDVEKASWFRKIFQNAKIKLSEQTSKYLG